MSIKYKWCLCLYIIFKFIYFMLWVINASNINIYLLGVIVLSTYYPYNFLKSTYTYICYNIIEFVNLCIYIITCKT